MARRTRTRFWDPSGHRYGIPTYPRKKIPPHLRTLRQLAAEGLRPGGQGPQAQVLWCSRLPGPPRVRTAYLYDVRFALPKRAPSPRATLSKASVSRRTCSECLTDVGYVLPRHLGVCLDCAEEAAA
ncbi:RRQRL motif-containing zinc-binding protein [Nonomuraea sp. NPDC049129]|uniref:RRQRL motif-containing zinc-binding protein n=1 Tax=Nonomuraea sp. NPDC049129 TaxID=3155272 RepID=UPI0033DA0F08